MEKEKEIECKSCKCDGMHRGVGVLMTVGLIVLAWGIANYLQVLFMWPSFTVWMVAGILMLLASWAKKQYK